MAAVPSCFTSADTADINGRLIASRESNMCLTTDTLRQWFFMKKINIVQQYKFGGDISVD